MKKTFMINVTSFYIATKLSAIRNYMTFIKILNGFKCLCDLVNLIFISVISMFVCFVLFQRTFVKRFNTLHCIRSLSPYVLSSSFYSISLTEILFIKKKISLFSLQTFCYQMNSI